jgi:2-(1,2-epoxy-1,2-dihydrophenyl)acetyl-CoA isomerase
MASEYILSELDSGVARLTLNRPDVLNSFNRGMALELQRALADAAADSSVRCVLLTGSGRAFCAGQDLADVPMGEGAPALDLGKIVRERYNPIVRAIRQMEKPVVCAVNGVAAGAGANLALCCDIVFAADTSVFVQAFSRIGLIPDTGGTFFLPRLVGTARATAMMMLDEKVPAQRAQELGMIYKVLPADIMLAEAFGTARSLAAMPTRGLGLTKRALNATMGNGLDAQLDLEEKLQAEAGSTSDFSEGVTAFLAKRKPVFKGT